MAAGGGGQKKPFFLIFGLFISSVMKGFGAGANKGPLESFRMPISSVMKRIRMPRGEEEEEEIPYWG